MQPRALIGAVCISLCLWWAGLTGAAWAWETGARHIGNGATLGASLNGACLLLTDREQRLGCAALAMVGSFILIGAQEQMMSPVPSNRDIARKTAGASLGIGFTFAIGGRE